MKIALNREYAMRHLGVTGLFSGLACWFLYDAVFVYPNLPNDGTHHTTVEFQYSFAALLALAAIVIGFRVWLNAKATLEWDDEKMWGTKTLNTPLLFADVAKVDDSRWRKKGILVLHAKDGRRVTLDAWHHTGVNELAKRFLPRKKETAEN